MWYTQYKYYLKNVCLLWSHVYIQITGRSVRCVFLYWQMPPSTWTCSTTFSSPCGRQQYCWYILTTTLNILVNLHCYGKLGEVFRCFVDFWTCLWHLHKSTPHFPWSSWPSPLLPSPLSLYKKAPNQALHVLSTFILVSAQLPRQQPSEARVMAAMYLLNCPPWGGLWRLEKMRS